MPQMAPYNWIFLYFIFIIFILLMISSIYFIPSFKSPLNNNCPMKKNNQSFSSPQLLSNKMFNSSLKNLMKIHKYNNLS